MPVDSITKEPKSVPLRFFDISAKQGSERRDASSAYPAAFSVAATSTRFAKAKDKP
ncbi:hypothetical protein PAE9249_00262 [Paenibacillus sp. CECT 9249]|nr:hypothetical protein PAE9249_00262 [Paenibacillus sp. CECT 9249]